MSDPKFVSVVLPDTYGVLRGKTLTADEFAHIRTAGSLALPQLVHALDPDDAPIIDFTGSRMDASFGDLVVTPDFDRVVPLTWRPGWAVCIATPTWRDGTPCGVGSRVVAQRALDRAASHGREVKAAFEYEVRLRRREDGVLLSRAHQFSVEELDGCAGFIESLEHGCSAMGICLQAIHAEGGRGLVEFSVRARPGLRAADDAALLKLAVRGTAALHDMTASFMAKPVAGEEGSSGHLHISLWVDGRPLFACDPEQPHGVNDAMGQGIAGALRNMASLSLIYNPTLNSYKRLVPGAYAPINASWGLDNRSAAVRAIDARLPEAVRVEIRRPGADSNPYLTLAAVVASMDAGIEEALTLPPPVSGDAGASDASPLPGSLEAACRAFRDDPKLAEWLGTDFVSFYAASRERELTAWRTAVSDWERSRYDHLV